RRIVFVLPFEEDFTLIGTTEDAFEGDPAAVACSEADAAYLCRAVSRWFARPVSPATILWRYAGVRPLYEDHAANASAVTRDYVLILDAPPGSAPLLSVLGGKITTYRRLAEAALDRLRPAFPMMPGGWTDRTPLPGGDLAGGDVAPAAEALQRGFPWLDPLLARRLTRRYGSEAGAMLDGAKAMGDLGIEFGAGLTAAEVGWLRREEWAATAEDILWRRTKLGLRLDAAQQRHLADYLGAR
ncbi:MAG TPA: glycerol-3-phosphate dehydrogenase C-terminal domain-containing protein, partial [Stellaceae bacterium]|nr:glycerol-3-phosphate dehydrogenase C-terminal domain-containing protein [Stellaceae bacterium]